MLVQSIFNKFSELRCFQDRHQRSNQVQPCCVHFKDTFLYSMLQTCFPIQPLYRKCCNKDILYRNPKSLRKKRRRKRRRKRRNQNVLNHPRGRQVEMNGSKKEQRRRRRRNKIMNQSWFYVTFPTFQSLVLERAMIDRG